MPHVHVDFHEQGINEPYYFAPAAEPFHEVISDWQRDFQTQTRNLKYIFIRKIFWEPLFSFLMVAGIWNRSVENPVSFSLAIAWNHFSVRGSKTWALAAARKIKGNKTEGWKRENEKEREREKAPTVSTDSCGNKMLCRNGWQHWFLSINQFFTRKKPPREKRARPEFDPKTMFRFFFPLL